MKFKLPFNDEWFCQWGGDTLELNHHHENPAQKFAFDFLIEDENKNSFINDGRKCTDYFCFEKEVLAVADGEVMQVVNGVEDNEPGYVNGYFVPGNSISIKHSENLFSCYYHFKLDSIKVKVGDKVKMGQVLGLCGNSGRSTEPHIHFHFQDNWNVLFAKAVKCDFENIFVKKTFRGKEVLKKKHSPIKGEFLRNK